MVETPPIWDVETHLIGPGMPAPKLVCMSMADEKGNVSLHEYDESLDIIENRLLKETTGNHHIFYDLGVVAAERPHLLPAIFEGFDRGGFHCTKIRQMMIDNAEGNLKFIWNEETMQYNRQNYQLYRLVQRLLGYDIQKHKEQQEGESKIWRLRFNELDGIPIKDWPPGPDGPAAYAMGDPKYTQDCWNVQQRESIDPDEIPGYVSEMQSAWALNLMGTWGFRTDPVAVREYKAELTIDFRRQVEQCRKFNFDSEEHEPEYEIYDGDEFGFRRGEEGEYGKKKRSRDMKKIKAVVEDWYKNHNPTDIKMLITDGGDIATSREQLTNTDHPGLHAVAESVKIEKMLTTYVPALERGTVVPINPNYNPIIETFRTSCSGGMKIDGIPVGMNCFSGDTELLTDAGWVRFDELKDQPVQVAQWSPLGGNEGQISFTADWRYIEKKNTEPMIRLHNQQIDLLVTPDHRCALRSSKTGRVSVFPASEYKETGWQQIHAGLYSGGDLNFSEAEITTLCAIQADGHYRDGGVDFSFTKRRKALRLRWALDEIGADFSFSDKAKLKDKKRYRIRLHKKSAGNWCELLGPQKLFGAWLLQWSRHALRLFCIEVFFWDGCATRMNHYSSNDKESADWVQIVLALSGKRARMRQYQGSKNINHQVDVVHKDYSWTNGIKKSAVMLPRSYCVSVPSSFIMVRRNNCVMMTGQCQNLPRKGKVRECVVPRPGSVFAFFDYDTLEMRTLAQVCIDLFGYSDIAVAAHAGLDFHTALAATLYGVGYKEMEARIASGDKEAKNARQYAKIGNYGLAGGMGPHAFISYAKGYGITVSLSQAKAVKAGFLKQWSEMPAYFNYCGFLCREGNAAHVVFPRSGQVRGNVRYTAVCNGNFQHLAAKGGKQAVYQTSKECYVDGGSPLYGCRPWLWAHDEIGMEIPYDAFGPKRSHEAAMRLGEVMIESMKFWCPDVPIGASGAMTRRWYKGAPAVIKNGLMVPGKPEGDEWVADL